MNLFKTLTLQWWQTGIFKAGMLALGIAIGAYLHDFFGGYVVVLIIVSALSLAYVTYVWCSKRPSSPEVKRAKDFARQIFLGVVHKGVPFCRS